MGKANKIFARTMAAVLSLTALLGATACGGGGGSDEDSTVTKIKVENFGGGVRGEWLKQAFDRFKVAYEGVEVTPGKFGIELDLVRNDTKTSVKSLHAQTSHMYFLQNKYSDCFTEIMNGNTVDLTDIVTTPLTEYGETQSIADKIAGYEYAMKSNEGQYHMLPHYEIISGASYDYELFKKYGWFLATNEGTAFTTTLLPGQTYYFTKDPAKMTVGNDGVRGTDDDGMPTTLNELVAQCARIKEDGVPAFSVAGIGAHIDYFNHLIDALWTSLAGYDQRYSVIGQTGEFDYVTGVTGTELWAGSGIYAPSTEKVTVAADYSNGWKTTMQAGKYYAYAFVELAYKQGWVYNKYQQSGYNHQNAMEAFMLNGTSPQFPEIGSHVEGSYWYNECKGYSSFGDYQELTGNDWKDIRHWHMPTSWGNDVVTGEANKRQEAIVNTASSTMLLNKKAIEAEGTNSAAIMEVCKQFFRFLCSEAELQNFTKCTGVAKALYSYTIDNSVTANLDPYQKAIMAMRGNRTQYPMVNQYANNPIARYQSGIVTFGASAEGFKISMTGDAVSGEYNCVLEAYYELAQKGTPTNAYQCLEKSGQNELKWATVLQNAGLVTA